MRAKFVDWLQKHGTQLLPDFHPPPLITGSVEALSHAALLRRTVAIVLHQMMDAFKDPSPPSDDQKDQKLAYFSGNLSHSANSIGGRRWG